MIYIYLYTVKFKGRNNGRSVGPACRYIESAVRWYWKTFLDRTCLSSQRISHFQKWKTRMIYLKLIIKIRLMKREPRVHLAASLTKESNQSVKKCLSYSWHLNHASIGYNISWFNLRVSAIHNTQSRAERSALCLKKGKRKKTCLLWNVNPVLDKMSTLSQ